LRRGGNLWLRLSTYNSHLDDFSSHLDDFSSHLDIVGSRRCFLFFALLEVGSTGGPSRLSLFVLLKLGMCRHQLGLRLGQLGPRCVQLILESKVDLLRRLQLGPVDYIGVVIE
jgi:hypothetical protein